MGKINRAVTAAICIALPASWKPYLLRLAGHRVHRSARIRCSLIMVDRMLLGEHTRIGRFNIVKAHRIVMCKGANIGHMNWISGSISIGLGDHAAIGHRNHINEGAVPGRNCHPQLRLGVWSKITAGHFVNVAESIILGNYSTVAGYGSQLWTHGYVHMSEGLDRAEVRGRITIGNNVYIGSNSTLQAGISIANAISVGAHASVAKSLVEPGVYVPQALRLVPRSPEERLQGLTRMVSGSTGATFYWRDGGGDAADSETLAQPSVPSRLFAIGGSR